MNTMKLAATMLAVTGAAGAANAALTTIHLNLAPDQSVSPITIGGSHVFTYGSTVTDVYANNKYTGYTGAAGVLTAVNGSGIGSFSATPTLPAIGESYGSGPVALASVADAYVKFDDFSGHLYSLATPSADYYLHVAFTDTGGSEVGYLTLDSSGGIAQIDYQAAGSGPAVPEPAAWALMFAGVAMTGGALRRSRRRSAVNLTA